MDLAAFVLARLAERERVAQAAYDEASDYRVLGSRLAEEHFVFWKPMEVLADVAAKRAIVELHNDVHECPAEPGDRYDPVWPVGWKRESMTPCPTLRLLAQPYADHEDYDPAWTVTT